MGRLSASYLERILRSVSGIAGGEVLQELKDLAGFLTLQSEHGHPEWAMPAGERWIGGHVGAAAGGAGARTELLFRNPPDSGIVAVIHHVSANQEQLTGWVDGTVLPANFGGALFVGHTLDSRLPPASAQGAVTTHVKNAGGATAIRETGRMPQGAAVNLCDMGQRVFCVMMAPGSQWITMDAVDNLGASWSFMLRERPIEGLFDLK